mgnify:CR=1 FL=1
MKNDVSNAPMIVIDHKNSQIRIHRNTLQLLGDPEYIQLLVNPGQHALGRYVHGEGRPLFSQRTQSRLHRIFRGHADTL